MIRQLVLVLGLAACAFGAFTVSQNSRFVFMNFDTLNGIPAPSQSNIPFDATLGSEWTLEFWVQLLIGQSTNTKMLLYAEDNVNYMAINCHATSTTTGLLYFQIVQNNVTNVDITHPASIGGWVHVTVAYKAGVGYFTTEMWKWGSLDNSLSVDPTVTNWTATIGFSSNVIHFGAWDTSILNPVALSSNLAFSGALDEFRVWNKFFNITETRDPVRVAGTIPATTSNLVRYYSFENDAEASHQVRDAVTGTLVTISDPDTDYQITWLFANQAADNYMSAAFIYNAVVVISYNVSSTLSFAATSTEIPSNLYPVGKMLQPPYGAKFCGQVGVCGSNTTFGGSNPFPFSFNPLRGACGLTQDVLITTSPPEIITMTLRYQVLPITPVLAVQNYTLPAVGGNIVIVGSNFGITGALDAKENITIRFPASQGGATLCTSPTVSNTDITCSIGPGVGKGFPIDINICNGVTMLHKPFFSYEAPVIDEVTLEASSSGNTTGIVIKGRNFGPAKAFPFDASNFIYVNQTVCDQKATIVDDGTITCETFLFLADGGLYPVSLSIGGQTAQAEVNYTLCPVPCLNGGKCVAYQTCDCYSTPYDGEICQNPVDCSPPCQNGGTCFRKNRGTNETVCACPANGKWKGVDCSESTTFVKSDTTDNGPLIIGVSVGGGGLVLILGALVVYLFFFRKPTRGTKNFIPLEKKDFTKIIYGDQLNSQPEKTNGDLSQLEQMLLADDLKLAFTVSNITQITEADKIAKALVIIFQEHNKTLSLLQAFIDEEVKNTESAGTLFRSNSMVSKMFKFYSRLIGLPYLYLTVGPELDELIAANLGLEVDPEKMEEGADLDEMRWMLMAQSQKILKQILNSSEECPVQFRSLFSHIKFVVGQRFPENVNTTIGGFIFLRFFCPAISSPEAYGILEEPPTPQARRLLILITKVLQNLSNDVEFGSKEPYMAKMNDFIQSNRVKLTAFYEKLIKPSNKQSTETQIPKNMKPVSLAVIANHIRQNLDSIEDPELKKRLDTIV